MSVHLRRFLAWFGLVSALTWGSALSAQQPGVIQGRITSQFGGGPVADAQVGIAALGLTTLSAADGTYRLAGVPTGEHEVEIQRIGFARTSQTVTVTAGQVITLDFTLTDQAMELDPLVVTGQGSEIARRRRPHALRLRRRQRRDPDLHE
ncbi:MAG: carboxypeptidase-like regulatory domain-containing protein, partial [Longimicrobiales bacterium]